MSYWCLRNTCPLHVHCCASSSFRPALPLFSLVFCVSFLCISVRMCLCSKFTPIWFLSFGSCGRSLKIKTRMHCLSLETDQQQQHDWCYRYLSAKAEDILTLSLLRSLQSGRAFKTDSFSRCLCITSEFGALLMVPQWVADNKLVWNSMVEVIAGYMLHAGLVQQYMCRTPNKQDNTEKSKETKGR